MAITRGNCLECGDCKSFIWAGHAICFECATRKIKQLEAENKRLKELLERQMEIYEEKCDKCLLRCTNCKEALSTLREKEDK